MLRNTKSRSSAFLLSGAKGKSSEPAKKKGINNEESCFGISAEFEYKQMLDRLESYKRERDDLEHSFPPEARTDHDFFQPCNTILENSIILLQELYLMLKQRTGAIDIVVSKRVDALKGNVKEDSYLSVLTGVSGSLESASELDRTNKSQNVMVGMLASTNLLVKYEELICDFKRMIDVCIEENRKLTKIAQFEHNMQQAILVSIKESYQPSTVEEEKRLISSEKTEESTEWMCKVSRAVSKSVDGLKTDLKDLSQQLQEPCQKLLTVYLDSVDDAQETDFDITVLSEEEKELLNISRASYEVISKGIPSVNGAITYDERWLLEYNYTISSRGEPSMRLPYEENRDALFASSYINQQRIATESKKFDTTPNRCVIS